MWPTGCGAAGWTWPFSPQAPSPRCRDSSCQYLATLQLPPATAPFATAERRVGRHVKYGAACLVSRQSALRSLDDLRAAVQSGKVEFVFVHPLSMSGHVAPREALRQSHIDLSNARIRFSFSHSESLRLLHAAGHPGDPSPRERVAFVWDDAGASQPDLQASVRQVRIPALDKLHLPHSVAVAASGFPAADRIRELLLDSSSNSSHRFAESQDWREQFDVLRKWVRAGALENTVPGATSLDELGRLLLQHARSHPAPPRLALVLSGGGAKCSYQVGAVEAIERKLAELRQQNPSARGLDIGLVVGTSGGAINSLPIALGISRSEAGARAFRDAWRSLDQRQIVRPSWWIRANMGLWFATLQTAVIIAVVRWRVSDASRRLPATAWAFVALAAVQIVMGHLPLAPWRLLGSNHFWHHAWLWASFGLRAAAWTLLVIGAGTLLAIRRSGGQPPRIPRWLSKTTLLAGLLGLPLLQGVNILLREQTLSGGGGMEQAVASKIPELINRYLDDSGQPVLDMDAGASTSERLRQISRQVIERELLQRDLAITGSCLSQSTRDLPSDLYFFAKLPSSQAPNYGDRGISLRERPAIMLDVILGSGSIFPVFPPRRIDGIPNASDSVELVDGGFAHNSPLEAAVAWGATHVLLIEATPRHDAPRGSFLKNAVSSFRHLHQQAQLLDARSRRQVIVFSLSPRPPHMCVLDFADNLIDASIERGRQDAESSSFLREVGEPILLEIQPDTVL